MATAERTDPELWEEVKAEIRAGSKGGKPGQWSARKAQMAVLEYKRRGGGYGEVAQDETDLHAWTGEAWGTKSGAKSGESGERYLPRDVRMLLTEEEYARTTARKRGGERQFVAQPKDIRDKAAVIRNAGPSREILVTRARDLGVSGIPDKSAAELLADIHARTDANGRALPQYRRAKSGH